MGRRVRYAQDGLIPSQCVVLIAIIRLYCLRLVMPKNKFHVFRLLISLVKMDSADTASSSREMSYIKSQLKPLQSNMPGRSLYDYILDALWKIQDMDDLSSFILDTPKNCMRLSKDNDVLVGLHSNSWLGLYLRELALRYKQFDFSSQECFWKQFLAYRSQSLHDRFSSRLLHARNFRGLEESIDRTQKDIDTSHSKSLLSEESKLSLAFSEFDSADYLHYITDFQYSERASMKHQYSLLMLANIQVSSGNLIEAALAFQESVNVAREAHDYNCLIIALIWFQQHPELRSQVSNFNKSEQSIMDFIKSQSKHVESAYLLSLVHLVGAKIFLLECSLFSATHLALSSSLSWSTQSSLDDNCTLLTYVTAKVWEQIGSNALYHFFTDITCSSVEMLCSQYLQSSKRGEILAAEGYLIKARQASGTFLREHKICDLVVDLHMFQMALNRRNLASVCDCLQKLESEEQFIPELNIDRVLLSADAYILQGDLRQAMEIIESVKHSHLSLTSTLRLRVKGAVVKSLAGASEIAVDTLKDVLRFTQRHGQLQLHLEALCALSLILIGLCQYIETKALLLPILAKVRSSEDSKIRGLLLLALSVSFASLNESHVAIRNLLHEAEKVCMHQESQMVREMLGSQHSWEATQQSMHIERPSHR